MYKKLDYLGMSKSEIVWEMLFKKEIIHTLNCVDINVK